MYKNHWTIGLCTQQHNFVVFAIYCIDLSEILRLKINLIYIQLLESLNKLNSVDWLFYPAFRFEATRLVKVWELGGGYVQCAQAVSRA